MRFLPMISEKSGGKLVISNTLLETKVFSEMMLLLQPYFFSFIAGISYWKMYSDRAGVWK